MININITVQNDFADWNIDTQKVTEAARSIFEYYINRKEISDNFCLKGYDYKTISFDFLFTDGKMTHIINKEYRNKDYPADIITFAIFADSDENERFVQEFEINLGEVIIALDKIITSAQEKEISKEAELLFMISHGIMHLLGFDHQTEKDFEFVVEYQKQALKSIGINYDKI